MQQRGDSRKKPSKLSELTANKFYLVIAGVIMLLAVTGAVYGALALRNNLNVVTGVDSQTLSGTASADSTVADTAEVLPQQIRINTTEDDEGSYSGFEPFVDPFADPMKLTGVVIGGRGGAMAIIESSGTSYMVAVGDYVDDLWAVLQITRDMVILRAHNQEVSLFFDQPPVTRSLDSYREVEDQEEGA
ncbi:MAG: hypothetical protein U1E11_10680 [Dethiobacteria bacterium]|nr:hypothetical protein [Dethiobacteria bacterium]